MSDFHKEQILTVLHIVHPTKNVTKWLVLMIGNMHNFQPWPTQILMLATFVTFL